MQLSIIIINYNTFALTCNCIQSVYDKITGIDFEIVLVDNASSSFDRESFTMRFPNVKLVMSDRNTGFAGGNNLGIRYATGDYLLLLNSDTELINNAPKICLDHLHVNPAVGMVTCKLTYPDGTIQFNCRRFRTITWELLEIFPVFWLLPKPKRESLMLHRYFDHEHFANCDWVWGAFMLFPRKILEQLPNRKLAEDFFMYCEDVLWCWQIKQLGYQVHFLPEARVMHIHKASTSREKLKKTRLTSIKNHANFMKKYYSGYRWFIFASIYYSKQYIAYILQNFNTKS